MTPWFERWPKRYEHELAELERIGATDIDVDEEERRAGKIVIRLSYAHQGKTLRLTAKFPEVYPFFRFEVYAPELNLPRHQDPFGKNLCLIGRSTSNWHTGYTLAHFVKYRVPYAVATATSSDSDYVAANEEPQGEPYTAFYSYSPGSAVIVGLPDVSPQETRGTLELSIEGQAPVRGTLLCVKGASGAVLSKAPEEFHRRGGTRCVGRWLRLEAPILESNHETFLANLVAHDRSLAVPYYRHGPDVIGVLAPEETQWRERKESWLFLTREKRGSGRSARHVMSFARAVRYGPADIQARIPELSTLQDKSIAVVGLGALGAPSAVEFARCGVGELRLMDGDHVEAGTTVRWPLGWSAFGQQKVDALSSLISREYPLTKLKLLNHHLGRVDVSDAGALEALLDGAHIVYDATAEIGVNYLLSELARERQIPYVWTSATAGGWGGLVGRIRPGITAGCWMCWQAWMTDAEIPTPNADTAAQIQPTGCADLSFTGASFDLVPVWVNALRLAISTLMTGAVASYPPVDWDAATLDLRTSTGLVLPPEWKTHAIAAHPSHPHG